MSSDLFRKPPSVPDNQNHLPSNKMSRNGSTNLTEVALQRISNECSTKSIEDRCNSFLATMREIYGDEVVDEAAESHSTNARWHLRIVK